MHFHKKKKAQVITTGAFFSKICNQVIFSPDNILIPIEP